MGLWDDITGAVSDGWDWLSGGANTVWGYISTGIHWVLTAAIEAFFLIVNIFDLLLGFLLWPAKNLTLQIYILRNEKGSPVISESELDSSIDYAKRVFKEDFNVNLKPYKGKNFVTVLVTASPPAALEVHCDGGAWQEEFETAGYFFRTNRRPGLAITAYVVEGFADGKEGCSIGPLTDYITIDPRGVASETTLAHEIGHSCGCWHSTAKGNLMWPNADRGDGVFWWQQNIFRRSRHVTYW